MLTSKLKVCKGLKKVKKNWSHKLKRNYSVILLQKRTPPRWEDNQKTLAHQTWKVSATVGN